MSIKGIISVALFCVSLVVSSITVADVKVGVVNMAEIMQKIPQRGALQVKLKEEFAERREGLISLEKQMTSLSDKLKRDKDVITQEELNNIQRDLVELQKEYKRKQAAFREDAIQRENEEVSKLVRDIGSVVDKIAKDEKYDLVIRREAAPFHISQKVDLTEQVVKAFADRQAK